MIHPNSRHVYNNLILPNIKAKHKAVIDALQALGEATVYELADYMKKPVHALSGRLTELKGTSEYERPVIICTGNRDNKYGNSCSIYRIKEYSKPLEQANLF